MKKDSSKEQRIAFQQSYANRYVQAEKIEGNTIDQIIEELIPPADYQHSNLTTYSSYIFS